MLGTETLKFLESGWVMWMPAGKQVLSSQCRSGEINDKQSFPLILLREFSFCMNCLCCPFILHIFQKVYSPIFHNCFDIWCWPVHIILFNGLASISFSACLTSPHFSDTPTHHTTLLSCCHFLGGHTVTLFVGSHAGVNMCMRVSVLLCC